MRLIRKCISLTPLHATFNRSHSTFIDGLPKPIAFALLHDLGYKELTQNQEISIQQIENGKDCVIHAPTGTGKTLCYLLPLVKKIYRIHQIVKSESTQVRTKHGCEAGLPVRLVLRLNELMNDSNNVVQLENAIEPTDRNYRTSFSDQKTILPSTFDSSVSSSLSTVEGAFLSIKNNPLGSFRPWVIVVPNRDLVSQVYSMLRSIDPLEKVSVQVLARTEEFPCFVDKARNRSIDRTDISGRLLNSLVVSEQIRWGAVDVVLSTPRPFVTDMMKFCSNKLYPGCIVFDEVDDVFHKASLRPLILDIIKYLRPRHLDKLRTMPPTQFIFVGATIPTLGPSSVGCMIPERFCAASGFPEARDINKVRTKERWISIESQSSEADSNGIISFNRENLRKKGLTADFPVRMEKLIAELKSMETTIVFTDDNETSKKIFEFLDSHGWPVVSYHSQMPMKLRMKALSLLFTGEAMVMVATDLAGRGIDMRNVSRIINFHFPTSAVVYLHRCGRVNRMGQTNQNSELSVINFVNYAVEGCLPQLIEELQNRGEPLTSTFSRKKRLANRAKKNRPADTKKDNNIEVSPIAKIRSCTKVQEASFPRKEKIFYRGVVLDSDSEDENDSTPTEPRSLHNYWRKLETFRNDEDDLDKIQSEFG